MMIVLREDDTSRAPLTQGYEDRRRLTGRKCDENEIRYILDVSQRRNSGERSLGWRRTDQHDRNVGLRGGERVKRQCAVCARGKALGDDPN